MKVRGLRQQLLAVSLAHHRAANRWAFNERDLWRMICTHKLMRGKPLAQRLRAYRNIALAGKEAK